MLKSRFLALLKESENMAMISPYSHIAIVSWISVTTAPFRRTPAGLPNSQHLHQIWIIFYNTGPLYSFTLPYTHLNLQIPDILIKVIQQLHSRHLCVSGTVVDPGEF